VVPILETRMADDGWRKARKPELHPPSSIHHPKTFSETIVTEMTYGEFVARYTKESGASEEAMRKVVKMLNGIAPLQANDYNAIEAFAREFILDSGLLKDALKMAEAKRFAAARARLGVKTIEGVDALILTKQVAFDQNALLAVQKVFSGTRVVVFIENENDLSEADRSFLAKLPEASRPLILLSDRLDDARKLLGLEAAGRALNLKAMVWGIETLPAALVRQLSDRIVLNTQRLESFLSVAGVSQLVSAMQAQYQATARAA
jgi:hypothetical protein